MPLIIAKTFGNKLFCKVVVTYFQCVLLPFFVYLFHQIVIGIRLSVGYFVVLFRFSVPGSSLPILALKAVYGTP